VVVPELLPSDRAGLLLLGMELQNIQAVLVEE
jgi:hypothetical protein